MSDTIGLGCGEPRLGEISQVIGVAKPFGSNLGRGKGFARGGTDKDSVRKLGTSGAQRKRRKTLVKQNDGGWRIFKILTCNRTSFLLTGDGETR